jgi:hypothetical protein
MNNQTSFINDADLDFVTGGKDVDARGITIVDGGNYEACDGGLLPRGGCSPVSWGTLIANFVAAGNGKGK